MSPAEVMAIEIEKVLFPVQTQDYLEQSARFDECKKAARAALRALAEMEPTPAMRAAWSKEENECAIHNYGGHPSCEDAFAIGLRAAGSEEANG